MRILSYVVYQCFVYVDGVGIVGIFSDYVTTKFGLSVDTAGYITAPRGLIAFIIAPIVYKLIGKVDARRVMFAGLLTFGIGCFMLSSYAPMVSQSYNLLNADSGCWYDGIFHSNYADCFIDVPQSYIVIFQECLTFRKYCQFGWNFFIFNNCFPSNAGYLS